MSSEDRATAFVRRTNEALGDLDRADELWTASVRSTTEEIRLHSLPIELDNDIRRVSGPFDTWAELEPLQVKTVREHGPINLMWVISAHPSGRVREAFVHEVEHLPNDRILPHLANRAIDFVPQIRELATPMLIERLDEALATFSGPDRPEALPTPVHIAVTKLLAPRTGIMSPLTLHKCIELASTAAMPPSRSLRGGGMAKMLTRCHRTLDAASEPEARTAVQALIDYLNQIPPASAATA